MRRSFESCTFVGRYSKSSSPSDSSSPTASFTVTVSLHRSSSSASRSSQPENDPSDPARRRSSSPPPPVGLAGPAGPRSIPTAASRPTVPSRDPRIDPVSQPSSAVRLSGGPAAPRRSLTELDRKRVAAAPPAAVLSRRRRDGLSAAVDRRGGRASSALSGTGSPGPRRAAWRLESDDELPTSLGGGVSMPARDTFRGGFDTATRQHPSVRHAVPRSRQLAVSGNRHRRRLTIERGEDVVGQCLVVVSKPPRKHPVVRHAVPPTEPSTTLTDGWTSCRRRWTVSRYPGDVAASSTRLPGLLGRLTRRPSSSPSAGRIRRGAGLAWRPVTGVEAVVPRSG